MRQELRLLSIMLLFLIINIDQIFTHQYILGNSSEAQSIVSSISDRWLVYAKNSLGLVWNYKDLPKMWEVCFSGNSLLQTESFSIPPSVRTIYADVTTKGLKCSKIGIPTGCSETIGVGAYLTDTQKPPYPPKHNGDFTEVPSSTLSHFSDSDYFKVTETVEFSNMENKRYIQFVFDSKNLCGSLINFKTYYYTCHAREISLAKFPAVAAPSKREGRTKRVVGRCVGNSTCLSGQTPYLNCAWDGTSSVEGSCVCRKGFTNVSASQCQGW